MSREKQDATFMEKPQQWTDSVWLYCLQMMDNDWKQLRTNFHACQNINDICIGVIKSLSWDVLIDTFEISIVFFHLWAEFYLTFKFNKIDYINYISWVKKWKFLIWPSMTRVSSPHMWISKVSSNFGGQISCFSAIVSPLTFNWWVQLTPSFVICTNWIWSYLWNSCIFRRIMTNLVHFTYSLCQFL